MYENLSKFYNSKIFQNLGKIEINKRQEELIRLLAKGFTLKEIAKILNATYYSIQKRTQVLYKKFSVNKRAELIDVAVANNIISYADLTGRYRKRFVKPIKIKISKVNLSEPLTEQELQYMKLLADGKRKKDIMKEMKLLNINSCNHLQDSMCKKLNAKNKTQALFFACILKLI